MTVAVRYYSKLGNTKKIAEAIAEGAGVNAVSITDEPKIEEHVDVLFLGGAPYANVMAPELRNFTEGLEKDKIDRAILFSTSMWSKRTLNALKKILQEKGISVEDDYFYAQTTRVKAKISDAKAFGENVKK